MNQEQLNQLINNKSFNKAELQAMKDFHVPYEAADLSAEPESLTNLLCQIEEILEEHGML